ncbi:MAG: S9 family peptidase [Halioglobus sp.]|nr:S9 family peptidase [Halioglobus sp.]
MRLLFFTVLLSAGVAATALAGQLPVAAFASLPHVAEVEISPSGKYLAYQSNIDGQTLLAVQDLERGTLQPLFTTDNERYTLLWYSWVSDDYVVCSLYFPSHRRGVATGETRLVSVHTRTAKMRLLYRPDRSSQYEHNAQVQDRVVSFLPDDEEHILLALDTEGDLYPAVFRINVASGKKVRVQRSKKPIRRWFADMQGRVRAGYGYDRYSGETSVWIHRLGEDDWQQLSEHNPTRMQDYRILGFDLSPDTLYLSADHEGKRAIYRLNTEDTALHMQLVEYDPDYDIDGRLMYSAASKPVVGVTHPASGKGKIFWDRNYQALQASIDRALPDTANWVVSTSRDERKYIVYAHGITSPGAYHYGDRDRARLTQLSSQYPDLSEDVLVPKQTVVYTARDGTAIEAYLSVPEGAGRELPALVFVHGGPISRVYADFDYWTQFFVNRGYAVIEPNFRGSSGYGFAFRREAYGGFGLAMQDDLADAAHWLVENGVADAGRICIVGGSYGGYAALMGIIKTPDLYRCAVSYAGPTDLLDLKDRFSKLLYRELAYDLIGRDTDLLESVSPQRLADKIQVPVLLAHGEKDRTVDVRHSRDMAKALKKYNKAYTYLELPEGSHWLSLQRNRLGFFGAMDTFLSEQLGGVDEKAPAGSGALGR